MTSRRFQEDPSASSAGHLLTFCQRESKSTTRTVCSLPQHSTPTEPQTKKSKQHEEQHPYVCHRGRALLWKVRGRRRRTPSHRFSSPLSLMGMAEAVSVLFLLQPIDNPPYRLVSACLEGHVAVCRYFGNAVDVVYAVRYQEREGVLGD